MELSRDAVVWGLVGGLSFLVLLTGYELATGFRASLVAKFGVALLGGIGFTMSIFIAELGFGGNPQALLMAKTGILFASLLAGVGGYLWLSRLGPAR